MMDEMEKSQEIARLKARIVELNEEIRHLKSMLLANAKDIHVTTGNSTPPVWEHCIR